MAEGKRKRVYDCVVGVCESDDGQRIELHLDGSKPECAEFTKLVGPKVMAGARTEYIVDAPRSRSARKAD
jgi:hypothetical protein